MHNELLSVVDQNDRIIDRRPRTEIHAQGLRHRAVHVLVFNDDGLLFLQKRSMLKDLNKGLWDTSVAGHVDLGEDYGPCALREAQEELGVDVAETLTPLFKLEATPQLGMEFVQVYRCLHNGPFVLAPEEIDAGSWFSPDEINHRVDVDDSTLTDTFKTIWRHYQRL
ncbi:NUDIX hydrolase [Methylomarinum vadi]|uniref:NUDIX hydrolase n=1 Tax=Methylomarinum vadi TaxID=438855 RepID=UPI0004DF04E0|nr:NUDIX domain-containing protein [Methylomarinum vadi]